MEDFFHITITAMSTLGFWPLSKTSKLETFKKIYAYVNAILLILLAFIELMAGIDEHNNVIVIGKVFTNSTIACICITKILILLSNRNLLKEIIYILMNLNKQSPIKQNEKIRKLTKVWNKRGELVSKCIIFLYNATCISYMIIPWWKFFKYGTKEFSFPTKVPFDDTIWRNFLLIYSYESIISYFVVWVFVAADSFFAVTIMFLCLKIEVLILSFNKAHREAAQHWKTTPLFRMNIEYHKNILNVCSMLEILYSPILLIQFFCSFVQICMLCFLSTQKNMEISEQITFVTCFVAMLVQLFIFCFFGQLLQSKFEHFNYAIFHGEWYNAPISYQKDVKFLLLRCRQPIILTAYKMMPVNLESYFSIVKTSMSFLALLQSMDEED